MDAISFKVKAFEVDLQFAMDVRKFEFVIEGDSMITSQALSEQSPPPFSMASVIYMARCLPFMILVESRYPMFIGR